MENCWGLYPRRNNNEERQSSPKQRHNNKVGSLAQQPPASRSISDEGRQSPLERVIAALRDSGLESSKLIFGIDFTKSNEWTGVRSFKRKSLHATGDGQNPYEQAIAIVGKALAPFDEDNLIPCFGFGDETTHDQEVFSFHHDHSPCHGFEEVLSCYRKIVPNLRLSGPTSFVPIIEAAVDIVERSHGQYHVLVIITDGQVAQNYDIDDADLSPHKETIKSIVMARSYPLSIVLVGVGDGPWDDMQDFDNFRFVNFTSIMARNKKPEQKEAAIAFASLMEVPFWYQATKKRGILGRVTGKAKRVAPRPPPAPVSRQTTRPQPNRDETYQACPVCLTNPRDMAFGCGHTVCRECAQRLITCPLCRTVIRLRLKIYTG